MTSFNAAKARAKRPCPLWADAFLRDTQHLGADEVGAYILLLLAMWTRESCDLPDDDMRLSKVCRVSKRLWDARIGPVLRPFLQSQNGTLTSKRLRMEASFVEAMCGKQSGRRTGEKGDLSGEEIGADVADQGDDLEALPKSDPYALPEGSNEQPAEIDENSRKPLKTNNTASTADITTDNTTVQPTQLPNYPTVKGGGDAGASHRQTTREKLLAAIGVDPVSGLTGRGGQMIGNQADMIEAGRWITDLGLTWPEVLEEIRSVMAHKHDGPPSKFSYFSEPMRRLSAAKGAPPLIPSNTAHHADAGQPKFDPLQYLRDSRAARQEET